MCKCMQYFRLDVREAPSAHQNFHCEWRKRSHARMNYANTWNSIISNAKIGCAFTWITKQQKLINWTKQRNKESNGVRWNGEMLINYQTRQINLHEIRVNRTLIGARLRPRHASHFHIKIISIQRWNIVWNENKCKLETGRIWVAGTLSGK